MGRAKLGRMLQICAAERRAEYGSDSSGDSDKKWETLCTVVLYGGCSTGGHSVEGDGNVEL